MQVTTIEGIVENGQIRLTEKIKLPEMTKVFVVIPNLERTSAQIMSPHLVDNDRIKDFEREIIEIKDDEI
jgi:predicted DNA-binding antitoxin AbrB/MazE fold protein